MSFTALVRYESGADPDAVAVLPRAVPEVVVAASTVLAMHDIAQSMMGLF